MHFSGMFVAQSAKMRRILTLKLPRSASNTLARPSRLLSSEDVLCKNDFRLPGRILKLLVYLLADAQNEGFQTVFDVLVFRHLAALPIGAL